MLASIAKFGKFGEFAKFIIFDTFTLTQVVPKAVELDRILVGEAAIPGAEQSVGTFRRQSAWNTVKKGLDLVHSSADHCRGLGERQILYCTNHAPHTAESRKVSNSMTTLRERQAPLKARYESDPESAKLVMTVRSATTSDDPTRCTVASINGLGANAVAWEAGAHPMAGGEGDLACSGDLLLASLAACQEITLRMVAAAMGIHLQNVEVNVEGDLDFRGTMGIDPETPVGFHQIRTSVKFDADATPDRLQRLADRAERYCVVGATLREGTSLTTSITARGSTGEANNG